jgi:hypothetical protein
LRWLGSVGCPLPTAVSISLINVMAVIMARRPRRDEIQVFI